MKLNRLFLLALCVLCMSGGCKYHVVYLVPPPIQDPNEVFGAAGKTIRWLPTGHPFKITFFQGISPCRPTDSLESDGKNVVTCHVLSGQDGDFEYYIGPPKNPKAPASSPGSGPYPAHVGSCNGCMPSNGVVGDVTGGVTAEGSQTVVKNMSQAQQPSTSSQTASPQEIRIYCDPNNKMAATAVSLTVSSGQAVYWKFLGNGPKSGPVFDVTIPANLCSNLTAGTKVNDSTVSCAVASSQTYNFNAYACTPPNGSGNITAQ